MTKTYAWNSTKENVHHDNTRCGPGSEIPPHNRQSGTGGKPLCKDCAKLIAKASNYSAGEGHFPIGAYRFATFYRPIPAKLGDLQPMLKRNTEGPKALGLPSTEAHGGLMKRVAATALARFGCFDAVITQNPHFPTDSGIYHANSFAFEWGLHSRNSLESL